MKYEIYEEILLGGHYLPYESKHAVRPEPGDLIIVHRMNKSTMEVVCTKDTNKYKSDTCAVCPLGNRLCLRIPMKCDDSIAFADINVLEDL